MPRVFGLNLIGVVVATVAFYIVGAVWYGALFQEQWMASMGVTAEAAGAGSPIWMAGGFLITIMQVVGIGLVLKWKGAAGLANAAMTAFVLWLVFALPFCHYTYLYTPAHDATLLMIDASHLLVGWVVSAVALSFFK